MNPLMPQGNAPADQPNAFQPSPGLQDLSVAHDQASAQYDKLGEAKGKLDLIRVELQSLAKLGDMVTAEDVIKGAGQLVGKGLAPKELAGLLADMPSNGGQALASWVKGHADAAAQNEVKLAQAQAAARHQLGVSAAKVLLGHSMEAAPQAPAPNQLMGAPDAN